MVALGKQVEGDELLSLRLETKRMKSGSLADGEEFKDPRKVKEQHIW